MPPRVYSSVVERCPDKTEVHGSIPCTRTMNMEGFPQPQPIEKEPLHVGNLLEVGKAWKMVLLNEGEPVLPITKEAAAFYIEKLEELKTIAQKEFAPGEKEAYEERLGAYIEKLKQVA